LRKPAAGSAELPVRAAFIAAGISKQLAWRNRAYLGIARLIGNNSMHECPSATLDAYEQSRNAARYFGHARQHGRAAQTVLSTRSGILRRAPDHPRASAYSSEATRKVIA
jgi:hypothetical protein